jgi:hypothetical protein
VTTTGQHIMSPVQHFQPEERPTMSTQDKGSDVPDRTTGARNVRSLPNERTEYMLAPSLAQLAHIVTFGVSLQLAFIAAGHLLGRVP